MTVTEPSSVLTYKRCEGMYRYWCRLTITVTSCRYFNPAHGRLGSCYYLGCYAPTERPEIAVTGILRNSWQAFLKANFIDSVISNPGSESFVANTLVAGDILAANLHRCRCNQAKYQKCHQYFDQGKPAGNLHRCVPSSPGCRHSMGETPSDAITCRLSVLLPTVNSISNGVVSPLEKNTTSGKSLSSADASLGVSLSINSVVTSQSGKLRCRNMGSPDSFQSPVSS